jgi:hypothetical protein
MRSLPLLALAVALALALLAAACGDSTESTTRFLQPIITTTTEPPPPSDSTVPPTTTPPTTVPPTTVPPTTAPVSIPPSPVLGIDATGPYVIDDEITGSRVRVTVADGVRTIESNGLPDHETGEFPNSANPNSISPQVQRFEFPADPEAAARKTFFNLPQPFGVAINGIVIDPYAAEFFEGDRDWQYEARGGIPLGIDDWLAHVQPDGTYHYHGIPDLYLTNEEGRHGPLFGWAGDGFPIYLRSGYVEAENPSSGVTVLASSYRLREGERDGGPGGPYDGTFVQDYEYVPGSGDLDECNGRFGITPQFPGGTYYYVLTDDFPFIPRCFVGTLAPSFVLSPAP